MSLKGARSIHVRLRVMTIVTPIRAKRSLVVVLFVCHDTITLGEDLCIRGDWPQRCQRQIEGHV